MLECIVTAINNDTSTISSATGINFAKHLTDEVREYLVTGGAYFDFRGRDSLIRTIRGYVPDPHWLLTTVKQPRHKQPLEKMIALRNFAAHKSPARNGKHASRSEANASAAPGPGSNAKDDSPA